MTMTFISLGEALIPVLEKAANVMKQTGTRIPGYRINKDGDIVPDRKAMPAHRRIASTKKRKFVSPAKARRFKS